MGGKMSQADYALRAKREGIDLETIDQSAIKKYVTENLDAFWWNCPDHFEFVAFLRQRAQQNIQTSTRISATS